MDWSAVPFGQLLRWRCAVLAVVVAAAGVAVPAALAAAAGPLPATRPTTQSFRLRIFRLIADLENDEWALREEATRQLIEIGPDIYAPLKRALDHAGTAELRQRYLIITAAIKEKWRDISPDGGPLVAGFQAVLRGPEKPAIAGAGLAVHVKLCNVGVRARTVPDFRGYDLELVDEKVLVRSPRADARVQIRKLSAAAYPKERKAAVYDEDGADTLVTFQSGGTISTRVPLSDMLTLAPGQYEVTFVWYTAAKGLLDDALDDLSSNAVRITVLPPGEQK